MAHVAYLGEWLFMKILEGGALALKAPLGSTPTYYGGSWVSMKIHDTVSEHNM